MSSAHLRRNYRLQGVANKMRLDKIYTKVGDKGTTMLATGQRVPKSSQRIEAYGSVDELNAQLGLLRDQTLQLQRAHPGLAEITKQLFTVQNELFDIGAELASVASTDTKSQPYQITEASIERLEGQMDTINEGLEPLKNFVLPGGHSINSQAHICRCVCRRAERITVRLHEEVNVRAELRIYLNRLSDWLFLASRFISKELSVPEVLWQQKR